MQALGVRRFKLVQHTLHAVELLYVPEDPGALPDPAVLTRLAQDCLVPAFAITVSPVPDIPPGPSGKNLYHESHV